VFQQVNAHVQKQAADVAGMTLFSPHEIAFRFAAAAVDNK